MSVVECKTALQIPVSSDKWTGGKAEDLFIIYKQFTYTYPTVAERKQNLLLPD